MQNAKLTIPFGFFPNEKPQTAADSRKNDYSDAGRAGVDQIKRVPGVLDFFESQIYERIDKPNMPEAIVEQQTLAKREDERRATLYNKIEFDAEANAGKKQPLINHPSRK